MILIPESIKVSESGSVDEPLQKYSQETETYSRPEKGGQDA